MTEQTGGMAPAIGQTLKNRRIQRNLTAEQVAQDTKIHIKFIRALEEERWQDFPARVYLEGFLKRYAEYLRLEEAPLVADLRHIFEEKNKPAFASPAPAQESDEDVLSPAAVRSLWLLFGIGVLAVALAVSYVKIGKNSESHEDPASSNLSPAQTETVAAPESFDLLMAAKSPVWSRVWVDDQVRFEGILAANVQKTWTVKEKLRIVSGNPALLAVSVAGASLQPKPGSGGEILWTKADYVPVPSTTPVLLVPEPFRRDK
jgi:cytoskeletal protein RodZ